MGVSKPVFYGPERGLVLFHKHANHYLSPYHLPDRGEIQQLADKQIIIRKQPA